jgi:NADP-dependent 3-hydroxy acid dehydrogenase YdfG
LRVLLIGAGCPLADAIAEEMSSSHEVIGISKRTIDSAFYKERLVFDFLNEEITNNSLAELTCNIDEFIVITCTGRFPLRKKLSDYTSSIDKEIYESNVLGFTIPYRATISNARSAKRAAYLTFGSVSQIYKYPMLSVFTAAKDALKSLVKTASHEEAGNNVKFFHFNLSTLDQEKEANFTSSDAGSFLPCIDVAVNIHNTIKSIDNAPFFVESDLYKHSETYYEKGYYFRIPKDDD